MSTTRLQNNSPVHITASTNKRQGTVARPKTDPEVALSHIERHLSAANKELSNVIAQQARQTRILNSKTPQNTSDGLVQPEHFEGEKTKLKDRIADLEGHKAYFQARLREQNRAKSKAKTAEIKLSDVQKDTREAPTQGTKRKASESVAQSAKLESAIQPPAKRQNTGAVASGGEFSNRAFANLPLRPRGMR